MAGGHVPALEGGNGHRGRHFDAGGFGEGVQGVGDALQRQGRIGHRVQLDLYQVYKKDGSNGTNTLDATKFELRYALADWGKIWGNPTLYGEWEQAADGPDAIEFKLMAATLADAPAWLEGKFEAGVPARQDAVRALKTRAADLLVRL